MCPAGYRRHHDLDHGPSGATACPRGDTGIGGPPRPRDFAYLLMPADHIPSVPPAGARPQGLRSPPVVISVCLARPGALCLLARAFLAGVRGRVRVRPGGPAAATRGVRRQGGGASHHGERRYAASPLTPFALVLPRAGPGQAAGLGGDRVTAHVRRPGTGCASSGRDVRCRRRVPSGPFPVGGHRGGQGGEDPLLADLLGQAECP